MPNQQTANPFAVTKTLLAPEEAQTRDFYFQLAERLAPATGIAKELRSAGVQIVASADAIEAIRQCGHPNAEQVACNLVEGIVDGTGRKLLKGCPAA